jgi:prolyl-tRNA editing enzyme YbaK/EbsC (Cys-tRNA(Pro) deacylase)
VRAALVAAGAEARIVLMAASTRTAGEAAAACGCEVGQIVKSLVFRRVGTGEPVLILAAGDRRVETDMAAEALGGAIERPDADYVRERTGFAIGGVAPVGHPGPIETIIDARLFAHAVIWAAAGTPQAVFPTTPQELERVTGARRAAIS